MPKAEKCGVCPGCSRHCPASSPRCKYGQKFFAKCACPARPCCCSAKAAKWEKHVETGGAVWQLLSTARSLKKAIRKSRITEKQILARLTDSDRETLSRILRQLNPDLQ